jgi:hypothetical protein
MNNLKLAVGFALALVLLSAGLYLNSKPKADPQQPTKAPECLSQSECVRSCYAINNLFLERLQEAKRINKEELTMLLKQVAQGCQYACKEIKNAP